MAKKAARKKPSPAKQVKPVELPLATSKPKEESAARAEAQSGMGSPNGAVNGDESGKPPARSSLQKIFDKISKKFEQVERDVKKSVVERAFEQILNKLEQEERDGKKSKQEKTHQDSENRKAIAKSALAFVKALEVAVTCRTESKKHESEAVEKVIELATKYTGYSETAPGHSLAVHELPSTWQVAQLAVQIGQGRSEMQNLFSLLPNDPTAVIDEAYSHDGYTAANSLTNAALLLWRSAHDMRQIWLTQPALQANYEASMRYFYAPPVHPWREKQNQVTSILMQLAPQSKEVGVFDENIERHWLEKDEKGEVRVNKVHFAEYWRDQAFVTFADAATLFFRKGLTTPARAGKERKKQSDMFAAYVDEILQKDTPEKTVREHLIQTWKNTTTPPDEEGVGTPTFLKPGYFTDLWVHLILCFEATLKRVYSKKMSDRRAGKKSSGNESDQ